MRTLLAGLCLCCAASSAHAQIVISGGDFERYLRPGYNIPSDGAPFSHRYGYTTEMSSFYFGHGGWRLGYLEYLDRQDRADKFGYHVPFDGRYEFPAQIENNLPGETVIEAAPVSHGRVGFGLGLFRRR